MKKVFKYFGVFLSVVLMGALSTACIDNEQTGEEVTGLQIKVFSPTKVVAGVPMTINGFGFKDAKEIVFPGDAEKNPDGVVVTSFKIVTDNLIRVNAPAGIGKDGGKIIVSSASEHAESPQSLTLGKPTVSGFLQQPGETIHVGEKLTVYGTDLEFINKAELKDINGNPLVISDSRFYNKSTGEINIIIPANVMLGAFAGKLYSCDGKEFAIPELVYDEAVIGGGHWEHQEKVIFNTETVFDGWSATLVVDPVMFTDVTEGAIVRVFFKDKGDDYLPIYKHVSDWSDWAEFQNLIEHTDEYFQSTVTAEVIDELKSDGLRFQGLGFTVTQVVLIQDVWIEGEDSGPKEVTLWEEETVFDSWSATLVIPAALFNDVADGQIVRVFFKDKDDTYNPIFKHVSDWSDWAEFQNLIEHTDEYFQSFVTPEVIDELQSDGLRFQGLGFTVTKIMLLPAE